VEQQRHDIASVTICHDLFHKLSECRVIQKTLLYSLITELRELRKEELLWSWKFAFNELKLSELFEVVEV
jgi:hypothetical protein